MQRENGNLGGIDIDVSWLVELTVNRRQRITIEAAQYNGPSEFRFAQNRTEIIGDALFGVVTDGGYSIFRANGSADIFRYDLSTTPEQIKPAAELLAKCLVEEEGYPNLHQTEGLARQICEELKAWWDERIGKAPDGDTAVRASQASIALAERVLSGAAQPR